MTAAGRDRLLMVAPVMPHDRGNGLAMRAAFFLDAYAQRYDVDLVVAPVAGAGDVTTFARTRARRIEVLDVSETDGQFRLARSVRDVALRARALRQYGKPSLAAPIAAAARSLDAILSDHDYVAIHVFRIYLAELAQTWLAQGSARPRLILDCDENDAEVHRRLAAMERRCRHPAAAESADIEAEAFARLVSRAVPQFDLVVAASRRELRSLGAPPGRGVVIPNVVTASALRPSRPASPCFSILFVGSLGYEPNAEAVAWFVSRVWRRLQRALNDQVRLVVVGSRPPPAIRRLGRSRGIIVTGAVADVAPFYQRADLVIAPIRAGGGTRIKIIEAAAYRLPIVASSLAAEGTTFKPGIDMLVADNEASFLRACLRIAHRRSTAQRLANRAHVRFKQDYAARYWRQRVVQLVANDGASSSGRGAD